ncbi:glycosyltransferase family 22 protein [Thermothelomyces thermophilus ATCC 42464]|uniref:Mannosyltransferase n=1 Tax=Thermothelomyces thermophilus (strain ATCC 42464 / BCRC 31852 / DSM 1799) TaxID=573729 RepID=G2QCZ6_THET4|nr:glycosyltransferase family 22 protein [Thermothelomyces thermophilus ATCC 42464]AEO57416.1 glycosyltransferase family 22 protein [Thermothelomyces thermophilus ATCC 42464]
MNSKPAPEGLPGRHEAGFVGEPPRPKSKREEKHETTRRYEVHAQVAAAQVGDILRVLLLFRFINALCVRTFFQPDEYFQALEPAWRVAFGADSGAWLTWEWQHQLRSSLHPAIFGLAYKAAESLMSSLSLFPPFKALMLVALPRTLQAVFAALADFYTWKLAMDIYGRQSNAPWAALWMTVLNPWQWYCSTRTFSNSLETTLTIAALCYWPWEVLIDTKASRSQPLQQEGRLSSLRISLVLAAVAVLLRPTNLLIWLVVSGLSLIRLTPLGNSPLQTSTIVILLRESIICGATVLAVSLISDRLYFGFWTFPPYKWFYFNISQSLAVFYGRMPWHYYVSQGVPLLTTTFLPFTIVGLYKATSSTNTLQSRILKTLNLSVLTMITILSFISHKEVRFIYPLLPMLHILSAPYFTAFFTQPASSSAAPSSDGPVSLRRKLTLANLISLNILLAGYLSLFHQPAPLSVLSFLRTEFERIHPDALDIDVPASPQGGKGEKELFALFLTPCHSTPWRSHLVYPALRARALTCEPPLHIARGTKERETYLDEADRFYLKDADGMYGVRFLGEEMWPLAAGNESTGTAKRRVGEVPRYIVGFEGIEPVLRAFFEHGNDGKEAPGKEMGVTLTRVWSAWNGAFNEDWRRRGRLVVWDTGLYQGSRGEENREEEGRVVDEL